MAKRLRILFAGSGAFGLPTLKELVDEHDVVRIYTQPDRPAGRGKKLTPTPIAVFADKAELPVTRTPKLNDEPLPEADALVVIAFGQKISQEQANHPRLGAMNLHASLLPRHRGAAPIHHALLAGDETIGNSVIRLAERMDAGPILRQGEVPFVANETTGELHDRLAEAGVSIVLRTLRDLDLGTAVELDQDESLATHAGKLSREDAALDFERPAVELARQINALSPWPGCRINVAGVASTLVRATAVDGLHYPSFINSDGLIGTGQSLLQILELRPDGGKPMRLEDYRNGRPWPTGERVWPVT
ncbi:MAG: methionyl-tRNA formyltransferase [Planctomycetota bacterium]